MFIYNSVYYTSLSFKFLKDLNHLPAFVTCHIKKLSKKQCHIKEN